jgi:hypothetical protein
MNFQEIQEVEKRERKEERNKKIISWGLLFIFVGSMIYN